MVDKQVGCVVVSETIAPGGMIGARCFAGFCYFSHYASRKVALQRTELYGERLSARTVRHCNYSPSVQNDLEEV